MRFYNQTGLHLEESNIKINIKNAFFCFKCFCVLKILVFKSFCWFLIIVNFAIYFNNEELR